MADLDAGVTLSLTPRLIAGCKREARLTLAVGAGTAGCKQGYDEKHETSS
jgi:hypothetical protein